LKTTTEVFNTIYIYSVDFDQRDGFIFIVGELLFDSGWDTAAETAVHEAIAVGGSVFVFCCLHPERQYAAGCQLERDGPFEALHGEPIEDG